MNAEQKKDALERKRIIKRNFRKKSYACSYLIVLVMVISVFIVGCVKEVSEEELGRELDNLTEKELSYVLYDEDGRLTDYARSLAPPMLELDLSKLPKLYPERYGNNYFEPGDYVVRVGDGFGKGDFLIKLIEFVPFDDEGKTYIKFEVFKRESDGNYYHFPTEKNSFGGYGGYLDLFGISLESNFDASTLESNEVVYQPNCNVLYNSPSCPKTGCNYKCGFDPYIDEEKFQKGIFSVVLPVGHPDAAEKILEMLSSCYHRNTEFLGYNENKPRIGLKLKYREEGYKRTTGYDEYITADPDESELRGHLLDFNYLEYIEKNRCPNYLSMTHEMTHSVTREIIGFNHGLNEGLADFVSYQNGAHAVYSSIACSDYGYYNIYSNGDLLNYVNLSSCPNSQEGCPFPSGDYYVTGFCFWQDFTKDYGYAKFVELMQALYSKSRGIDDYYVYDVMEEVIGGSLSENIQNRYGLTRDATYVEICDGCEMFVS